MAVINFENKLWVYQFTLVDFVLIWLIPRDKGATFVIKLDGDVRYTQY